MKKIVDKALKASPKLFMRNDKTYINLKSHLITSCFILYKFKKLVPIF